MNMIILQALTETQVVQQQPNIITIPVLFLFGGLIILSAGVFVNYFYKKKKRDIFETEAPVEPVSARVTYSGEGGEPYDSFVAGSPRTKDGKIYADLDDGTRLMGLSEDEWDIQKNVGVWRGKTRIICRRDATNTPMQWAAPEIIKTFLRATETSKEKVKSEVKEEMTELLEFIAASEDVHDKMRSPKKELRGDEYSYGT